MVAEFSALGDLSAGWQGRLAAIARRYVPVEGCRRRAGDRSFARDENEQTCRPGSGRKQHDEADTEHHGADFHRAILESLSHLEMKTGS